MTDFNENFKKLYTNYHNQQNKVDVTGDGKYNKNDTSEISKLEKEYLANQELWDMDGDGKVDQKDLDMFSKALDIDGDGKISDEEVKFQKEYIDDMLNAFKKSGEVYEYNGKMYKGAKGATFTGVFQDKYYKDGVLAAGSVTTTENGTTSIKNYNKKGVLNTSISYTTPAPKGYPQVSTDKSNITTITLVKGGTTVKVADGYSFTQSADGTFVYTNGSTTVKFDANGKVLEMTTKDGTVKNEDMKDVAALKNLGITATCVIGGKYYAANKIGTGVCENKYYKNGVLSEGSVNNVQYNKNGEIANGLTEIGTKTYMFENGVKKTGEVTVKENDKDVTYYYKNGEKANGEIKVNNTTYYYVNGLKAQGKIKVSNTTYMYKDGIKLTGVGDDGVNYVGGIAKAGVNTEGTVKRVYDSKGAYLYSADIQKADTNGYPKLDTKTNKITLANGNVIAMKQGFSFVSNADGTAVLTEKDGDTFNFDATGKVTSAVIGGETRTKGLDGTEGSISTITFATTNSKGQYLVDGKDATGTYNGLYYSSGKLFEGKNSTDQNYYVNGHIAQNELVTVSGNQYMCNGKQKVTGIVNDLYYNDGSLYSGTVGATTKGKTDTTKVPVGETITTYKKGVFQYSITDNNNKGYPNGNGQKILFSKKTSMTLAIGDKAVINADYTVTITSKDGKITNYDENGNITNTSQEKKDGTTYQYTYDEKGNKTHCTKTTDKTVTEYEYKDGKKISAVKTSKDGSYTTTYKYENDKAVSAVKKDKDGKEIATYQYTYDAQGLKTRTETRTDGKVVITKYDSDNNKTTSSSTMQYDNVLLKENKEYNVDGSTKSNIISLEYQNGTKLSFSAGEQVKVATDGTVSVTSADGQTVKQYDKDGNEIVKTQDPTPITEGKGSTEYAKDLLAKAKIDIDLSTFNVETDGQGRVTKLTPKGENIVGGSYTISYKEDGSMTIQDEPGDKGSGSNLYTFNADGRLTQKDTICASLNPNGECKWKTVYAEDGSYVVTGMNATGEVLSTKKYDKNGKEITDNQPKTEPIQEGKGSVKYIADALGQNFDAENWTFEYDDNGQVTKISSNKISVLTNNYEVKYNADGSMEIIGTGAWTDSTHSEYTYFLNKNGELTKTQKKETFDVQDDVVVTTKNADGSGKVENYDKAGNLKSTKDYPKINAGEKGSIEYLSQITGIDFSEYFARTEASFDLGKVMSLSNDEDHWDVKYNDDGTIQVQKNYNQDSMDFDSDGKLTRKVEIESKDNYREYTITTYNKDGSYSVEINHDGELISLKQYDKNGNEITETPTVQPGEKGSKEYTQALLEKMGISINPSVIYATYDEQGRITQISNCDFERGLMCNTDYTYTITYNEDGSTDIELSGFGFDVSEMGGNKYSFKADGTVTLTKADGTIKKYDANGQEITTTTPQAGEVGSQEYTSTILAKLAGVETFDMSKYDVTFDESGRITKVTTKETQETEDSLSSTKLKSGYNISYDENGNANVTAFNGFATLGVTDKVSVFNKDGRLIKEYLPHAVVPNPNTKVIDYNEDGSTVLTTTYGEPIDGVAKVVTTTAADGTVTVKKYDANGQEITETSQVNEKGSVGYVTNVFNKLFEENNTYRINPENCDITYDEQGRVTKLTTQNKEYSYNITYNTDGISVTMYSESLCGFGTTTYTFNENGKLTQKDIINPSLNPTGECKWRTVYAEDGSYVVTGMNAAGEVLSTKKYDKDGQEITETPTIPAGEKGSKEFAETILKKLPNNENIDLSNYDIQYDSQGRIINIKTQVKSGVVESNITRGYNISYDENGNTTVVPFQSGKNGATNPQYVFNNEGRLIREYLSHAVVPNPVIKVIDYNEDGSTVLTTTFGEPMDGVAKIVTTTAADGTVTVKKYDKDGKEITETSTIQPGEKGSIEYLHDTFAVMGLSIGSSCAKFEYDSQGRIVKIYAKPLIDGLPPFEGTISYNDDGSVLVTCTGIDMSGKLGKNGKCKLNTDGTFEVTKADGTVKKYDKDGKEITETKPSEPKPGNVATEALKSALETRYKNTKNKAARKIILNLAQRAGITLDIDD